MNPVSIAAVARAAEKATPGPWVAVPSTNRWHGDDKPIFPEGLWAILPADDYERIPLADVDRADDHHEPTRKHAQDDAEYIAAANPRTVLALCAALTEARERFKHAVDVRWNDDRSGTVVTPSFDAILASHGLTLEGE